MHAGFCTFCCTEQCLLVPVQDHRKPFVPWSDTAVNDWQCCHCSLHW